MANDIAHWLDGHGLGQYAQAFADNDVDFEVLPDLTDDELRELGLSLGHRKKLLRAIENRNEQSVAPETTTRQATHEAHPREAERRQLTVLFCDLVGSTALASRLDPEDMREVLRSYQDACAGVVKRHEGFVAKYMGDGVLVYFGYPTAHEDDAERAINAGLGIVEAVGGLAHDLQVRIGVATGTVAVGDIIGEGSSEEAAIVGEAPNLAARLQEIAEPDTVVIGEATRALVGDLFEAEDLGARDFKGFSDKLGAWAVLRPHAAKSRFEATRGAGLSTLVGRDEEMAALMRRWERSKTGDGQVVLLSGEPGIGKSRLIHEFRNRVADGISNARSFECSPQHSASTLFPFIEQTRGSIGLSPDDSDAQKLDKLEAWLRKVNQSPEELAPVFGPAYGIDTTERYPRLDVSPERYKRLLMDAFGDRMKKVSESHHGFLLTYEDAHWMDPTSLEYLDAYIDLARGLALMMIVSFRPEFVAPWVGQPHTVLIALNRLDKSQSAALASHVGGARALSSEITAQIADRTDGVPLFVEEIPKAILESPEGTGTARTVAVPATLQDSLEARLDRLGSAKEIAQIGSVIGREFSHGLLAEVTEMGETALHEAVFRLLESGLVFGRGQPPAAIYTFKHALVQDTAYGSLLRNRRVEIHSRIASALERKRVDGELIEPGLLAHHFSEAGLAPQGSRYWIEAAQTAMDQTAIVEGIAHADRGLNVTSALPDGRERNEARLKLLLILGAGHRRLKGPRDSHVLSAYEAAFELVLRFQRLFPTVDLFDDGACGSRPDEERGVGVVLVEVVIDGHLQVDDGVEHATTYALSGDLGEEALDQVEPGRRCRREMHVEAGMTGQPRLDLGVLVGGVVVGDQVDIEVRRDLPVDPVEEADELLMPVLVHALADHPTVEHIERREQGGGAVALVVVGHGSGPTLLHGQARLGAVERLDLGLLVDRQHDGVLRRVEIQPDHVLDFLGKPWIVGQLEGRHQVRLQAMRLPDRLNARRRDAHRLGHRPQAPVGGVRRHLRHRLLKHPVDHCRPKRRLARRARLVAAQAVHAGLDIARPPTPDGWLAHAQAALNLVGADAVAGQRHDPRTPNMFLRRVAVSNQRLQPIPIPGPQLDPHLLAHAGRFASNTPVGNHLFRAEH